MEELLKEILDSIKTRQNGITNKYWNNKEQKYKECTFQPSKGKGTIAYTIRRIDILQDKLKELKADLKAAKYDFKG